LQAIGKNFGWELLQYYPTMYANKLVPAVNSSFVFHYFECFRQQRDLVVEPIKVNSWRIWSPSHSATPCSATSSPPNPDRDGGVQTSEVDERARFTADASAPHSAHGVCWKSPTRIHRLKQEKCLAAIAAVQSFFECGAVT